MLIRILVFEHDVKCGCVACGAGLRMQACTFGERRRDHTHHLDDKKNKTNTIEAYTHMDICSACIHGNYSSHYRLHAFAQAFAHFICFTFSFNIGTRLYSYICFLFSVPLLLYMQGQVPWNVRE